MEWAAREYLIELYKSSRNVRLSRRNGKNAEFNDGVTRLPRLYG